MSEPVLADLVTVAVARHFARWEVAAVVSPTAAVAAELVRRAHRPDLAVVGALGAYDTVGGPVLLKGEWGVYPAEHHDVRDLFALVAQGRVAIFATPGQVDAQGRANLGGIGGWRAPRVALPGSRGLPDDAASLPGFAYLLPSSRVLVPEVDYVSAGPPRPGEERTVVMASGVYAIGAAGWRCLSRHGDPLEPPFPVAGLDDAPATAPPSPDEQALLAEIDPRNTRAIGL